MDSFQEISKSQFKLIKALATKRYRIKHNLFIAEGRKVLQELFSSNLRVKKCWLTETDGIPKNIEYELISKENLALISHLQNPHYGLAIVEIAEPEKPLKEKVQLVLDGIADPGNLGTIIRLADWYGIKNIFCTNNCVDAYNPKVVQATMGSLFRVKVNYLTEKEIDFNKNVIATVINGDSIYNLNELNECTIVIGSEAEGISPTLLEYCDKSISIPKRGKAESLNAGVATGIILDRVTQLIYS